MDQWINLQDSLPDYSIPVWAYACTGDVLVVCRLVELNVNSEWDLGKEQGDSWCVLRKLGGFSEGDILPMAFMTHWVVYDPDAKLQPEAPNSEKVH